MLDGARAEHTQAVQDRIDAVGKMKDVVSLTEGLFTLSKVCYNSCFPRHPYPLRPPCRQETAKLESEAFVQRQRVALAAEVKTVLDSWVRFEQQEKENEQSQLVKSVVNSVLKNISEEKTQKEVLAWAVTEVEREFSVSALLSNLLRIDTELVKNKAI